MIQHLITIAAGKVVLNIIYEAFDDGLVDNGEKAAPFKKNLIKFCKVHHNSSLYG